MTVTAQDNIHLQLVNMPFTISHQTTTSSSSTTTTSVRYHPSCAHTHQTTPTTTSHLLRASANNSSHSSLYMAKSKETSHTHTHQIQPIPLQKHMQPDHCITPPISHRQSDNHSHKPTHAFPSKAPVSASSLRLHTHAAMHSNTTSSSHQLSSRLDTA